MVEGGKKVKCISELEPNQLPSRVSFSFHLMCTSYSFHLALGGARVRVTGLVRISERIGRESFVGAKEPICLERSLSIINNNYSLVC